MIERSLQQNLAKPIDISEYKPVQNKGSVVSVTMIELCYHNIEFSLKVDLVKNVKLCMVNSAFFYSQDVCNNKFV